ncbi:OmpA family protein [bacterium]|nr:OmpA family protein [bacterium]
MSVRNIVLFIFIFILFSQSLYSQDRDLINIPARPTGMGGAFVATADDANAPIWNPAGMEQLEWRTMTGTYSRLHWGVENEMFNEGYFAYVHHFGRKGRLGSLSLFASQFFSDVYSKGTYGLSYAKRLWGIPKGKMLALGFNARVVRTALNESNFEGVDPDDPLLENLSKISPAFDVGLFFRPSDLFDIGVVARNLNEPNVAISGEDVEEGKIPLNIRGGVKFNFGTLKPSLEVGFTNSKVDENQQISAHMGVEQNLWSAFTVRGGYVYGINKRQDATIGLGYLKEGEKLKWGFDYGLLYPLNDIGLIATTHKFGFNLFFAPPPILLEDLELVKGKVDVYPTNLYEGSSVEMTAKVKNIGEKNARGVKVTVYYQDTLGNWQLIKPVDKVNLKVGEEKELKYEWTPPHRGDYVVYMAIDDRGTRLPDIDGDIREEDELNNQGMGQFKTFALPVGKVQPKDRVLSVSELVLTQEEEPIIPVVFFDVNSTEITNPTHLRMLETVAKRMKINSDSKLFIKGFYSPGSDNVEDLEALALTRADAVMKALLDFGVDESQVEVEKYGYSYEASRSGTPENQLNLRDRKLQMEENRRAEIYISVTGNSDFVTDFLLENGNLSEQDKATIMGLAPTVATILEKNNEMIIICEGYTTKNTEEGKVNAFNNASKVAKFLKAQLEPQYADKVYLVTSVDRLLDDGIVRVFPNAEGVVFRPREGDLVLEDYQLDQDSDQNLVKVNAFVDAGVDSFSVRIINEEGDVVKLLAAGKGEIPEGLGWDWRDESGHLLDFDDKYLCKLDITDKLGERFITTSDTMSIEVTKRASRVEKLIIVEFVFNEQKPQSNFLESRVEYVAKHLIKRAEKTHTTLYGLVSGHTDSIGAEYANRLLSQERAERELKNLKRYLIYLLDLNDQQGLDKWLDQNNVQLYAKGFWETRPYVITMYRNGKIEKYEIGDNSTPVGRTINRRVLLELTSEYLGEESQ